jgi:hypothetical protein
LTPGSLDARLADAVGHASTSRRRRHEQQIHVLRQLFARERRHTSCASAAVCVGETVMSRFEPRRSCRHVLRRREAGFDEADPVDAAVPAGAAGTRGWWRP